MLLWVVKGRPHVGWGSQQAVDLASQVALQAANDLRLGEPLGGPSRDVVLGTWVPTHPADGEQIERPIGVAIATAVEPMAGGPARGGRQRRDSTQPGKGALALQPLRVIAGGHKQGAGGLWANALDRQERRGRRSDELGQLPVEGGDLGAQLLVARREGFEREPRSGQGRVQARAGPERRGYGHEAIER